VPDSAPDRSAIEAARATFRARLDAADSDQTLKALHDEFLSRKSGSVTALMKTLGTLPPEARREFGALVNALKTEIETALDEKRTALVLTLACRNPVGDREDRRPHAGSFVFSTRATFVTTIALSIAFAMS